MADSRPLKPDDATLELLEIETLCALQLEVRDSATGQFPSDCRRAACSLSVIVWSGGEEVKSSADYEVHNVYYAHGDQI